MLSLACKAAIKAVVYLGSASNSGSRSCPADVAEFINENVHTVGKILQKLAKEGIICSLKGPRGGFYVTSEQMQRPVIDIVHAIDGKEVFEECGLGLRQCSESHPCPFHDDFKPIREEFRKLCNDKKVIDLHDDVNRGIAYLKI